jgi:hypothetical protein
MVVAGATAAAACGGASSSPTSPSDVSITVPGTGVTTYTYTTDVRSILTSDCTRCHNSSQHEAGFDFTSYAGVQRALTAGSDQSVLVRVTQPGGLMYSELSGNRTQKVQIIYDWVVNSHAAQ